MKEDKPPVDVKPEQSEHEAVQQVEIDRRHLHLKIIKIDEEGVTLAAEDVYTFINKGSPPLRYLDVPIEEIRNNLRIFSSSGSELTYMRNEEAGTSSPRHLEPGDIRVVLPAEEYIPAGGRSNITLKYSTFAYPESDNLKTKAYNFIRYVFLFRVMKLFFLFYPRFAKISILSLESDKEPRIRNSINSQDFRKTGGFEKASYNYSPNLYEIVWVHAFTYPGNSKEETYPAEIEPRLKDVIFNAVFGYFIIFLGAALFIHMINSLNSGAFSFISFIDGLIPFTLMVLTYSLVPPNEPLLLKKFPIITAIWIIFLFFVFLVFGYLFYELSAIF